MTLRSALKMIGRIRKDRVTPEGNNFHIFECNMALFGNIKSA
jgi:hypothetical protein